MLLIEVIISGVFATLFMDVCGKLLAKKGIVHPFITKEKLGRWFLYMFRGKFIHVDISKTPPLKNEKLWSHLSHYLIGVILSGFYLYLVYRFPVFSKHIWLAIIYGIATVVFPWFWLLPGINLGSIAIKAEKRLQIIKTNIINHTNFGLGIFLWMLLFHP